MGRNRIDAILTDRAARIRRRFEIPVLIAALAVVPVIFIEENATSTFWLGVANWANWGIWLLFLSEFVTVLALTRRRLAYARLAWLDIFIIVSSLPVLPGLLAGTRLLRLARLLRVLRLGRMAAVVARGGSAAGVIFRSRGLGYVVVVTLLVAMGVGGVFALLEGTPIVDGLWWAIVTVTTVGYGDMFPFTPLGRAAAAMLMLLGIGFVAVITASVAAHFIDDGSDGDDLAREVRRLHSRLDQIEDLLRHETSHC